MSPNSENPAGPVIEVQPPGDLGIVAGAAAQPNLKPERPRQHGGAKPAGLKAGALGAAVADSMDAQIDDEEMPTRRARTLGGENTFEVPERLKRRGWDYQWHVITVIGQPVDVSLIMAIQDAGWRPVLAGSMEGMVPNGYDGKYIERGGQRLYTRPMSLTEEARAEDYSIASTVMRDKLRAAMAAPTDQPATMPRNIDQNSSIEIEVGTYKPQSKN